VIGHSRPIISMLATGALAVMAICAPDSHSADDPVRPAPALAWKARGADVARTVVEVTGVDASALRLLTGPGATPDLWRRFLSVRVVQGGAAPADGTPPLLGTYRVDGAVIRFEPRFPLEPGVRYRAEFDPDQLDALALQRSSSGSGAAPQARSRAKVRAEFFLPARPTTPTATVTAVYPSRATLPENLLRFYIHFSAPMSRGEAYRHIRLLDASGKPVVDPFLELD